MHNHGNPVNKCSAFIILKKQKNNKPFLLIQLIKNFERKKIYFMKNLMEIYILNLILYQF